MDVVVENKMLRDFLPDKTLFIKHLGHQEELINQRLKFNNLYEDCATSFLRWMLDEKKSMLNLKQVD